MQRQEQWCVCSYCEHAATVMLSSVLLIRNAGNSRTGQSTQIVLLQPADTLRRVTDTMQSSKSYTGKSVSMTGSPLQPLTDHAVSEQASNFNAQCTA